MDERCRANRCESLAAFMPHASLRPHRLQRNKQLKNKHGDGSSRPSRTCGRPAGVPRCPRCPPTSFVVVVNFFWTLVSLPSRFISAHFCLTSNNPARHISADEHIVLRQSRVAGMRTKTICGALYFFFFSPHHHHHHPNIPRAPERCVASILT